MTEGWVCRCGLPMSKNPHSEAGTPAMLTEVGYVWECIPCLNANRGRWANRAHKAEGTLKRIKEYVEYGRGSDYAAMREILGMPK